MPIIREMDGFVKYLVRLYGQGKKWLCFVKNANFFSDKA